MDFHICDEFFINENDQSLNIIDKARISFFSKNSHAL